MAPIRRAARRRARQALSAPAVTAACAASAALPSAAPSSCPRPRSATASTTTATGRPTTAILKTSGRRGRTTRPRSSMCRIRRRCAAASTPRSGPSSATTAPSPGRTAGSGWARAAPRAAAPAPSPRRTPGRPGTWPRCSISRSSPATPGASPSRSSRPPGSAPRSPRASSFRCPAEISSAARRPGSRRRFTSSRRRPHGRRGRQRRCRRQQQRRGAGRVLAVARLELWWSLGRGPLFARAPRPGSEPKDHQGPRISACRSVEPSPSLSRPSWPCSQEPRSPAAPALTISR